MSLKLFVRWLMQTVFLEKKALDIFLGMLDESKFDLLFEEEMENIGREVISYRHNRYII